MSCTKRTEPYIILDPSEYDLVTMSNGSILTSDQGQIGLYKKSDGRMVFVDASEAILKAFNLLPVDDEVEEHSQEVNDNNENNDLLDNSSTENPCTHMTRSNEKSEIETTESIIVVNGTDEKDRIKWKDRFISQLINLRYEKYAYEMSSTSTKNEVTWKKIADEITSQGLKVTSTQCYNKWRELNKKYNAKKDNMRRETGTEPVQFKFFDEMDQYLAKKHNVNPIAIASSLKGDPTFAKEAEQLAEKNNIEDQSLTENRKRNAAATSSLIEGIKKKKSCEDILMDIQQHTAEKEKNRERRHKELLESRREALNVFKEEMTLLRTTHK